jgi:hypothetical protein
VPGRPGKWWRHFRKRSWSYSCLPDPCHPIAVAVDVWNNARTKGRCITPAIVICISVVADDILRRAISWPTWGEGLCLRFHLPIVKIFPYYH